ncbi:MAG: AraC family transcriptional regulator [Smithella sp.]|nr:AraC family transcriptional regulator [Smithella sp.]
MMNKNMTDSIYLITNGTLPNFWSINGVAVLASIMEQRGIDKATLLKGSGIHPYDLDDPDALITPEQELRVLRKIPALVEDQKIGLILGQEYHAGVQRKLGAAVLCCDTALDAVRLIFKYAYLIPNYFQFELKVREKNVFLRMKELIDLKDIRTFVCEIEFVSVFRMCSDVLGNPIDLNQMRLAYPKPVYAAAYKDYFRCPVQFNDVEHMMVFDRALLSRKLPMSNPMARKTYEKECEQLSNRLKAQETVTGQVRNRIMSQSEGLPSFSRLAESMNISVSTLRRRLTEEETSYKNLVAEILKEKAIDMIQTTACPMEKIALDLGYSDLANFYRAFKVWTGHNPGYYRKNK